ncbi:hypothetical protein GGR50DRAFT_688030 [Xylaria sp. CBS 124048]|nr:hypothetical protein GGR50DRAFT_688030 [Xylaria sp. CBS 124048]
MQPTLEKDPATLPDLVAVRGPRSLVSPPAEQPYSVLDLLQYYSGTDRDLIWGPFYKRFRAARRQKPNWEDFSLEGIWRGIPATAQTRPGVIRRAINWVSGVDPPPTVTPEWERAKVRDRDRRGAARRPKTPMTPRRMRPGVDGWQDALPADDWSPARVDFTEWYGRYKHPADYDDDFYRTNYAVLYGKLCEFAEKWFGGDVYLEDWRDNSDYHSLWDVPMTEQFIEYARVVAHEDRDYVEWSDMLNDPHHRKWLCVSIISQIMEQRIFDTLLFGADEFFQEELERHDSQWVLLEGFSRKEGRRHIARTAIGEGLVPSGFWDSVDDLAGQTVLIFQPLFQLMCLAKGRSANRDGATFWQEIHTILAMAGYFQVCMSVSPSIFHILSATPGSRFQWEEEEHADRDIYDKSRAYHRSVEDRWRHIAQLSMTQQMPLVQKLLTGLGNGDDQEKYLPFPGNEEEFRVFDHERRRGGKVMYAVFPKLTRYSAENIGEVMEGRRPTGFVYGDQEMKCEGMRISMLSRCMVVYYQGLVHADDDNDDGIPLERHLEQLAKSRMPLGLLPYKNRFWSAEGKPSWNIHWPVWPQSLDKFWLFWLLSFIVSFFVRRQFGIPSTMGGRFLAEALMIKSPDSLISDAIIYLTLRASGAKFFQGNGLYLKMQGLNFLFLFILEVLLLCKSHRLRLFGHLASPFMWLDTVFFDKLPSFVMGMAWRMKGETPTRFLTEAVNKIGGWVMSARGKSTILE